MCTCQWGCWARVHISAWSSWSKQSQGWHQASVSHDKGQLEEQRPNPSWDLTIFHSSPAQRNVLMRKCKEVNCVKVPILALYMEKTELVINLTQKSIHQINLEGIRNEMYLLSNPSSIMSWLHWTRHTFCYWVQWDPELSRYHFKHTLPGLALENHLKITVWWRVNSHLFLL